MNRPLITPLVTISAKDVTKVEETLIPGILDLRLKAGVLEKLVSVRRVTHAGPRQVTEHLQQWRPVDILK